MALGVVILFLSPMIQVTTHPLVDHRLTGEYLFHYLTFLVLIKLLNCLLTVKTHPHKLSNLTIYCSLEILYFRDTCVVLFMLFIPDMKDLVF